VVVELGFCGGHGSFTRFLFPAAAGAAKHGPEAVPGGGEPAGPAQLQYAQTVLLNFNGLSWPHITIATLCKS
jgi:hypothetical protein